MRSQKAKNLARGGQKKAEKGVKRAEKSGGN